MRRAVAVVVMVGVEMGNGRGGGGDMGGDGQTPIAWDSIGIQTGTMAASKASFAPTAAGTSVRPQNSISRLGPQASGRVSDWGDAVVVSNPFMAGGGSAVGAAAALNSLSLQGGGGLEKGSSEKSGGKGKDISSDTSWQGVPYASLGCWQKTREWAMPGTCTLGMAYCTDNIPDSHNVTSPGYQFPHFYPAAGEVTPVLTVN